MARLLEETSIGTDFSEYLASIFTEHRFPLLTLTSTAVVSVFLPSSGVQRVIQGFIKSKASLAVGMTAQRELLALSVGDHAGHLVSPLCAVVAAGIARIDFLTYIAYDKVWIVLWVGFGALCFTFLPA